jgi:6-pyruvoyltetrahydropterin/6-carboxytetrahydropterin synthase
MLTITKRLEFDAGHRIPDHRSKCRSLHGHRYVLEITLEGEPVNAPGCSDHGMLMDFTDVKAIAMAEVVEPWDHGFLVWREDRAIVEFLATLTGHNTVLLDRVPTVENLAQIAFEILQPKFVSRYGNALRLARVRLFETPNAWAEVVA